MDLREVFHRVLEVTHVSKEIFREFFDGFYCCCWSDRGSGHRISIAGHCRRWGWVSSNKCGYENEEQEEGEWEDSQEVMDRGRRRCKRPIKIVYVTRFSSSKVGSCGLGTRRRRRFES